MIYIKKWKIEFYTVLNDTNPIFDYINTLPIRDKAKIISEIDLLHDYGVRLGTNKLRKISGRRYDGLWELRIRYIKNYYRILYFLFNKNTFVLIHCFLKKSKKTERRHLELARKRMADYIKRRGK